MKSFIILVADDWEIQGDGSGNVAELQYIPALRLMEIAKELGIRLTFMVDVAQRLCLERFKYEDPDLMVQARLWDDTVCLMAKRGFDVQLHLHPQWIDARYENRRFVLGPGRNLGRYNPNQQQELVSASVDYLGNLLGPIHRGYQVVAFKAGCWGLQPSEPLLSILAEAGIKIVLGVRDGMHIPAQGIDYRNLQEPYLPYHPRFDDVTKVAGEPNQLVVIPLQPHDVGPGDVLRLAWHLAVDAARSKIFGDRQSHDTARLSTELATRKARFSLSLRPYRTHLKLGKLPFSFMKHAFDQAIGRLHGYDVELIPILVECHSKDLQSNFDNARRFLEYLCERYRDAVEFWDLSTFCDLIRDKPSLVKSLAASGVCI